MTTLDRQDVRAAAAQLGLHAWASKLEEAALESLRIVVGPGRGLPLASRFGGLPAMAPATDWPHCNSGEMLAFIAQIRLDDIPDACAPPWLPRVGLLSFFYEVGDQPEGLEKEDRDSWRVFWFEDLSVLRVPKHPPEDEPAGYLRPRSIQFKPEWTLPEGFPDTIMRLRHADKDELVRNAFVALQHRLKGTAVRPRHEGATHRLLGHPELIQSPMERDCEDASKSLRWSDRTVDVRTRARDWRLLLQVDTDDKLDTEWCDSGRIYFWIREQDARDRRFDRAWLVLQSC